jgi:cytochrome c peroxidase
VKSDAAFPNGQPSLAEVDHTPRGLPQFFSLQPDAIAKAAFGQFLFFSPLLSRTGKTSCSSCHDPSLSFGGNVANSVVVDGLRVNRMPPPLINLYNARLFMWDGRAIELVNQVRLPLESEAEMNIDWPESLSKLGTNSASLQYLKAVGRSILTRSDIEQSIAEFVSRIITLTSAFDLFYYGRVEHAIDESAKKGLELFSGKARCSSCHSLSGDFALFTDNSFHVIGTGVDTRDLGRFLVTGDRVDIGAFKTPTLRNVALRKAYMHDGSMTTLRQVLEFYNRGGNQKAHNLDSKINPLNLSEAELEELEAFLRTLSSDVAVLK